MRDVSTQTDMKTPSSSGRGSSKLHSRSGRSSRQQRPAGRGDTAKSSVARSESRLSGGALSLRQSTQGLSQRSMCGAGSVSVEGSRKHQRSVFQQTSELPDSTPRMMTSRASSLPRSRLSRVEKRVKSDSVQCRSHSSTPHSGHRCTSTLRHSRPPA